MEQVGWAGRQPEGSVALEQRLVVGEGAKLAGTWETVPGGEQSWAGVRDRPGEVEEQPGARVAKQGIEEGASGDLFLMGSLWLSCRPAPGDRRRSRETGWEPIVASQVRGDGPWSRWHQLGGETGQTPGGSPGHV